jgi:uncharacterized membrane protein YfcA
MWFGKLIRKRIPEQQFRRVFFFGLLILGLYIIAKVLLRVEVRTFFGLST